MASRAWPAGHRTAGGRRATAVNYTKVASAGQTSVPNSHNWICSAQRGRPELHLAASVNGLEHEERLALVCKLLVVDTELHAVGVLLGWRRLGCVQQDGPMGAALQPTLVRRHVTDIVARRLALVVVRQRWRAVVAERHASNRARSLPEPLADAHG